MTDNEIREFFRLNESAWNERTAVHYESSFYDVQGFLGGQTSLNDIELDLLPKLKGKRLLHLQCHFGLDTLSLCEMGAICTGVDISPVSIQIAKNLSEKKGLTANFICSNVIDYISNYEFDVAFSSYGVINWLPDLRAWGKRIAQNLKSGGTFILVEYHPFLDIIDGYSYFRRSPYIAAGGTYADGGNQLNKEMVNWPHTLSDVINALIENDMELLEIQEYPFSPFNCFRGLKELERGRFYRSHNKHNTPLVFSLVARKK